MLNDGGSASLSAPVGRGHAYGRRLYRIKDQRLLRRLPWKSADRAPILDALGSANVPASFDVRALRQREGLSRQDFASIYGLSLDSVRSWERGVVPSKATRAYLACIWASPHIVRRALGVRF
jgi:DNA-binding XRE family transcriptional regulator